MANFDSSRALGERYTGRQIQLAKFGTVVLGTALRVASETAVYLTDHPEVVVKVFDLDCGLDDEFSYGPFVEYQLEVANFEEIQSLNSLRPLVPAFYGSDIVYEQRFAYVGMEFLVGQDLQEWCDAALKGSDVGSDWVEEFHRTVFETFETLERFHQNRIVVIDFKPENVIRLSDGRIRFVDMGAFFTPRHLGKTKEYLYSATPDYAELMIDSSNVESGIPLTEASDIFAAGVAMFEMVTGESRLTIAPETADAVLDDAGIFLFRDSQIKDVWKSYPHLEAVLPLVETQLKERSLLFSEFWHVLKGYLADEVAAWESLSPEERDAAFVSTGETFIKEHLPEPLSWLAKPIAQATTLRSLRIGSVAELKAMIREPVSAEMMASLESKNVFVQYLRDLGQFDGKLSHLNQWDVRLHEETGAWALSGRACCYCLGSEAAFTSVVSAETDFEGHTFFHLSGDDGSGETPQSLVELQDSRTSWIL